MAITNSIKQGLVSLGIPGLGHASSTSTTITSNAVTAAGTLPTGVTINFGYVRLKVSGVDTSHAISSAVITASDGTTTEYILPTFSVTSGTNGQGADAVVPFASDLKLNAFSATVTFATGVTAATVDLEVFGN